MNSVKQQITFDLMKDFDLALRKKILETALQYRDIFHDNGFGRFIEDLIKECRRGSINIAQMIRVDVEQKTRNAFTTTPLEVRLAKMQIEAMLKILRSNYNTLTSTPKIINAA